MKDITKCLRCGNTDLDILNQHNTEVDFNYDTGETWLKCFCDKCGYKFTRKIVFKFNIMEQYDDCSL